MFRKTVSSSSLLALLAIVGVWLFSGCSGIYTFGYVTRVLTKQDSNTDDYLWKHSVSINAADSPISLEGSANPASVQAAFADGSIIDDLEGFLEQSSTTALIVVHNDEVAYEGYFNGSLADQLQATFSVSKSVFSILVGHAIEVGAIKSMEDAVTEYLPELAERDHRFNEISLADLIDMRSGIAYASQTSFPFVNSDAPLVYYAADMRSVVLKKTEIEEPSGEFHYNDYNPNLLALVLERTLGVNPVSLIQVQVFNPIGAEDSALWSIDDKGFPYWESGFVATARDIAKIGQMMLHEGLGPNGQVMSKAWHKRSTTSLETDLQADFDGGQWDYRNGWWQILRPEPPHDYAAIGRFGQMLYVSPRNSVVIVRTGLDENPPNDGKLTRIFYAGSDRLNAAKVGSE